MYKLISSESKKLVTAIIIHIHHHVAESLVDSASPGDASAHDQLPLVLDHVLAQPHITTIASSQVGMGQN